MLNQNIILNSPELWLSDLPKLDEDSNNFTRGHAVIMGGYSNEDLTVN